MSLFPPKTYLTAFEHQPVPVAREASSTTLSAEEAERLALLGERRPGFCTRGYESIKLAQYCGVVNLGNRVLEILPKIDDAGPPEECRGILLRLLRQASQVALFRDIPVDQTLRHAPLLEVFIAAFFESVTRLVRGGLIRRYEVMAEDLGVVRGAILTARQFGQFANRTDLVACRFDELTADNVWNRVIKAGLQVTRRWILSAGLLRRWIELMAVFTEVETVRVTTPDLDRLVFDRQADRYRRSIEWVRWIVALLSPALRAGTKDAPSLLFDMNVLFQEAVFAKLHTLGSFSGFAVSRQDSGKYLAVVAGPERQRAFRLRPDVVIRKDGKVETVADTKWKQAETGGSGHVLPAPDEVYQMQAYALAYECNQLVLVYPWHRGLVGSQPTSYWLPRTGSLQSILKVMFVDVGVDELTTVPDDATLFESKSQN